MNLELFQGILWLADLQDDFELLDYKKFRDQNKVILILGRRLHGGICSGCGKNCSKIHSTDYTWIRDLSAFGYQVELRVERFTFWCEQCAGYRVEQHWLSRPRRAFTWRYEKHISRLCEEMTNASVGRLEELHDKTVYTMDFELLEIRMGYQKLPELGPHYSMDEVYFRYYPDWHPEAGKKFVTNLLDLTHGKVICNSPGRDSKSAENCLLLLTPTQRRRAQSMATDLHPPFHSAIRLRCPNADIVLDRFHIMQLFNNAMEEFRRQQLGEAWGTDQVDLLRPQNKWILLTREERLSKTDRRLLDELKRKNERVVEALLIREYFVQFFQMPTLKLAKLAWYRLLKLVTQVNIPAFTEFFRKLKAWASELWNYFKHRSTSAVIEAVNHKIKATKQAAYGYRNLRYYQLKILQRVGFLNSRFAALPRIHNPRKSQPKSVPLKVVN
ncbi:MAG TPA: ISL3 family transposase [Bdellovibrionales bacterium]|nr:ISL3 family transposase [Bdellovibrionales bacterium]